MYLWRTGEAFPQPARYEPNRLSVQLDYSGGLPLDLSPTITFARDRDPNLAKG